VPDEKFRDKVHKSLRENLTTLTRELPTVPPRERLEEMLIARFAEVLGPLTPRPLPASIAPAVARLEGELTAEAWLLRRGRRTPGRHVKIAAGREVIQRAHKAPGGLIRATVEVSDGTFAAVDLSGDFFFYPPGQLDALASALVGTPVAAAEATVAAFYAQAAVESPGVTPGDWAKVLA